MCETHHIYIYYLYDMAFGEGGPKDVIVVI